MEQVGGWSVVGHTSWISFPSNIDSFCRRYSGELLSGRKMEKKILNPSFLDTRPLFLYGGGGGIIFGRGKGALNKLDG